MNKEELELMRQDLKQNANLPEKKQLEVVAQLHACSVENVRQILQGALPVPKKEKMRRRHRYPPQLHQDLVKAVLLDGQKTAAAAEQMGVEPKTAYAWVKAAKKEREAFYAYAEQVQCEQHHAPAVQAPAEQPKAEQAKTGQAKAEQAKAEQPPAEQFPAEDPALQELKKGEKGLSDFLIAFAAVDIFEENEWEMLSYLYERVRGFCAGVKSKTAFER